MKCKYCNGEIVDNVCKCCHRTVNENERRSKKMAEILAMEGSETDILMIYNKALRMMKEGCMACVPESCWEELYNDDNTRKFKITGVDIIERSETELKNIIEPKVSDYVVAISFEMVEYGLDTITMYLIATKVGEVYMTGWYHRVCDDLKHRENYYYSASRSSITAYFNTVDVLIGVRKIVQDIDLQIYNAKHGYTGDY